MPPLGVSVSAVVGAITMGCALAAPAGALPLSPGDRIRVSIPEGEEFSGIFEVDLNGNLDLPYVPPMPVVGLESDQIEALLSQELVQGGFFQPSFLQVSANVVQWAPIEVFVSGETFAPGRVLINELSPAAETQEPVVLTGQHTSQRFLSAAIRAAGGVLPNANLTDIQLTRQGQTLRTDISGIFTGEPFQDVPLVAGDRIFVPDSGHLNPDLVRPSQITPPGIKVLLSNLTVPAAGNAIAAVGNHNTSFAYGSRFSHAVVAANCAGGIKNTNAGRRALLVTTDRLTGRTTYLERKVDDILKESTRDADNPFLMPDDVVACYDSRTTQVRDILDAVGQFFTPFNIIKQLFR